MGSNDFRKKDGDAKEVVPLPREELVCHANGNLDLGATIVGTSLARRSPESLCTSDRSAS